MQKPETTIVNEIQEFVRAQKGYVLKLHGNSMQRAGEPDLIGHIYGKPFAVEVKDGDNFPSPLQVHRLRQWGRGGFIAGVVWSLKDFKEIIGA
jgi:hypothetical protein